MLAMRAESRRLIWPAPTPMVMPPAQNTMALDLTYLATFQANSRSCSCSGVGCSLLTTFRSASVSSWLSAVCIKQAGADALDVDRLRPCPSARGAAGRQVDLQNAHVDLGLEHFQRLGREAGRHQHFDELLAKSASAARSSSVQLKAMMPPKAEVGSVLKALL